MAQSLYGPNGRYLQAMKKKREKGNYNKILEEKKKKD